MKIWKSFAGEHSAKLKIIGTFKTEENAEKAAAFYNDLIDVEDKSKGEGEDDYFSQELIDLFQKHKVHSLNETDVEQADYHYKLEPDGNRIEVLTDELEVQSIIKTFIRWGAKIELYSRHDY